jgi:hypothetical protein
MSLQSIPFVLLVLPITVAAVVLFAKNGISHFSCSYPKVWSVNPTINGVSEYTVISTMIFFSPLYRYIFAVHPPISCNFVGSHAEVMELLSESHRIVHKDQRTTSVLENYNAFMCRFSQSSVSASAFTTDDMEGVTLKPLEIGTKPQMQQSIFSVLYRRCRV